MYSKDPGIYAHNFFIAFVHKTAVASNNGGTPGREADEHLSRVILYEDVNEYLFSLSSFEARLSLVLQFVDFFGGKTSQW